MKIRGCFCLAVLFTATLAYATILPPGTSGAPPDVFSTNVSGPYLANTGVQPYTTTNALGQHTITGTYDAEVYSDPSNVFCAGCLDFFVTVTSSSSSIDDIERITLASFSGFSTDVGYSTGTGSVAGGITPSTVDRSGTGSVIGFNFTGVGPTQSTQVLEIQTNATAFTLGTLQVIDSSVASVAAYAPAVPEAGSISLTLLGGSLVGLGAIARRRKSTTQARP